MSHHTRPPGPPPYTAAQIARLSTPTERFIAQAELNSYIVGHRLADLREKELSSAHLIYPNSNDVVFHGNLEPTNGNLGISQDHSRASSSIDQGDTYRENTTGSVRGHSWRDSTRCYKVGRGYRGYHPYEPSQHARINNSTGANKATSSVESLQALKHSSRSNVNDNYKQSHGRSNKYTTLCPTFTSTGKCARLRCTKIHDTDRLALCKRWLYKDDCPKGTLCDLSHLPTAKNTPHCLYFLEDRCTNSPCSFAHSRVDPAALVCEAFGRLGYCELGDTCDKLHVYECPEFANEGDCTAGDTCTLRHVHHASRMKAAARLSSGIGTPRSNEEIDSFGSGTDNSGSPENFHEISQQHDYVPFELES